MFIKWVKSLNGVEKFCCLVILCMEIAVLYGVFRAVGCTKQFIEDGKNKHLVAISVEDCEIKVPDNIVTYYKSDHNNMITLESEGPLSFTTVHIYSLKKSSTDELEMSAKKLSYAIDEHGRFETIKKYDNGVFCRVEWRDGYLDMYTYLYFVSNNNTSFYVRVDLYKQTAEIPKAVERAFSVAPTSTDEKKDYFCSFNYNRSNNQYVFKCAKDLNIKIVGLVEFSDLYYLQGYQFNIPHTLWESKLINYGCEFKFEYPMDINFKYLEYKPLSKSEIKDVCDSYIANIGDRDVIASKWIYDNMLKVDATNSQDEHITMLFISDENCCFAEELIISNKDYNLLKDNINEAFGCVKKIDWSNAKSPVNSPVYIYDYTDDTMYFNDDGSRVPAVKGISKKLSKTDEAPQSTHHFPDRDETYNWRDYIDAESFASDHEEEMDYFEALEYYDYMHEKYAEEFE